MVSFNRFRRICLTLSLAAAVGAVFFFLPRASVESLVERAKQARSARDLPQAQRWAEAAIRRDPKSPAALRILGQVTADQKRFDEAIGFLESASRTSGLDAITAAVDGGKIALQLGNARQAETFWRRALDLAPNHIDAASQLAYLLGVEGRGWETQQMLVTVVRGGQPTLHHLVLLAASEPVIKDPELVSRCLGKVPEDLEIRTGQARTDLFEGRTELAMPVLRSIVRVAPELGEAQARLGWALLELQPLEFPAWLQSLSSLEHPEIWAVKGAWEMRQQRLAEAAHSFAQAIRRDPDHRMANYSLGSVLAKLNRTEEAQLFLDRASKLQQLALLADRIYAHPRETFQMRQAAELNGALGRPHEAWGWCWLAMQINPRLEWAVKNSEKFRPWLKSKAPRSIPEALPRIPDDLLIEDKSRPSIPPSEKRPRSSQLSKSEFDPPYYEEVARQIGIDFVYDAGSLHHGEGVDLIEFTGGGVAAFDYDLDDLPDLYFTQGRSIPLTEEKVSPIDRLFRQVPTGEAVDVTLFAGLGDPAYSQGCTAGDFNQDGFPDLYVCNVGQNRLYQNNGDGTFSDVTEAAGLYSSSWTVSTLFVDLNGDGLPELFDLNYLDIDLSDIPYCRRGNEDVHCAPTARPPAPDQVWLNLGNGQFYDVSKEIGLVDEKETGRGLGIVAADLNGDAHIDLFIANDAEPNFLYFSQPSVTYRRDEFLLGVKDHQLRTDELPDAIKIPQLHEQAVISGVAYDSDGLAQACMGVAIGDVDRNGMLELFVTNYADQSNTLYAQLGSGLFQDVTRSAGLREPSYALLGFGTQFLDGDLDGWLDLVLTNGHVYDMAYAGKQYAMRPQYFRNTVGGNFVEEFRETAGEFFGGKYVGRGLALVDWNRDGLEDFVISHIGSPAALVLNRTERHGHFIRLVLTGTTSERDATGTKIHVIASNKKESWFTLTGGSGYQAHNEGHVVIGLGNETEIHKLEITWPSGLRQQFKHMAVDRSYRVIESRDDLIPIRANDE